MCSLCGRNTLLWKMPTGAVTGCHYMSLAVQFELITQGNTGGVCFLCSRYHSVGGRGTVVYCAVQTHCSGKPKLVLFLGYRETALFYVWFELSCSQRQPLCYIFLCGRNLNVPTNQTRAAARMQYTQHST
jgi:hypothetical protein